MVESFGFIIEEALMLYEAKLKEIERIITTAHHPKIKAKAVNLLAIIPWRLDYTKHNELKNDLKNDYVHVVGNTPKLPKSDNPP